MISPWKHHIDRDHAQGREIASKMRKDFSLHGGNIDYVLMHTYSYVCVERQREKEKVVDQWVKALIAKSDNLNSSPTFFPLHLLLWPLLPRKSITSSSLLLCVCAHTYIYDLLGPVSVARIYMYLQLTIWDWITYQELVSAPPPFLL